MAGAGLPVRSALRLMSPAARSVQQARSCVTDIAAFHDMEHTAWQRAAGAYDKGWGALTSSFIPTMLNELNCGEKTRLLDIATGPGYVAEAASLRGAQVSALDFSANMLELAQSRLKVAGHGENIDWVQGDAEDLTFDDLSFDCIACNFGVLHLPTPARFFKEAKRVLKPGGRLAFTVWAPSPKTEAFSIIQGAVQRHGDPDAGVPPGPPMFLFSDAEEASTRLGAAGLTFVKNMEVPAIWRFETAKDAFVTFRDGTGRTQAMLRAQTPEQLAAIEAEIVGCLEKDFKTAEGHIEMKMPCVMTIAE